MRFHPAQSVPLTGRPGQRSTGDGHAGVRQYWSAPASQARQRDSRNHLYRHWHQSVAAVHVPQPSREWSPGMAACNSRRCCQPIIPRARRAHRLPVARLVSHMVRKTAITTSCSVTLSRYRPGPRAVGSITSITVSGRHPTSPSIPPAWNGTCPTRITISGVQGNPNLNGMYNNADCDSGLTTIYFSTPSGVPNWSYGSTYPNSHWLNR